MRHGAYLGSGGPNDGLFENAKVYLRMDIIYAEFLEVLQDSEDPKVQFKTMVSAYVWAAALVEANVNANLRAAVGLRHSFEEAESMFQAMERLELPKKVTMMRSLVPGDFRIVERGVDLPADWDKRLRPISDMRNRLMHYKDSPTAIPQEKKFTREDMKKFKNVSAALEALLPNAKLYDELIVKKVDEARIPALELKEIFDRLVTIPPQEKKA